MAHFPTLSCISKQYTDGSMRFHGHLHSIWLTIKFHVHINFLRKGSEMTGHTLIRVNRAGDSHRPAHKNISFSFLCVGEKQTAGVNSLSMSIVCFHAPIFLFAAYCCVKCITYLDTCIYALILSAQSVYCCKRMTHFRALRFTQCHNN